jgi:hypothetical protein
MRLTESHLKDLLAMAGNGLTNYIVPGLESHLFSKARVFVNTRKQEAFVTPHSHRYNLACLVLDGSVCNSVYEQSSAPSAQRYALSELHSVSADEPGKYQAPALIGADNYIVTHTGYREGEWYLLPWHVIHSITFSDDAKVLVLEGPAENDFVTILEPVVRGERVATFRVEPWMFQHILD